MNPTKTTNKIHFDDLDPLRFETLALTLLSREMEHSRILHQGAMGNDGGVDIELLEKLKNGENRTVYVQCKRYKRFSNKDASKAIDVIVEGDNLPQKLLFIVSCPVSKRTADYIKDRCRELTMDWDIWSDSKLESLLYKDHPDLLRLYFGIDLKTKDEQRKSIIERNIQMRDTFIEELMKDFKPSEAIFGTHRFHYRAFIIQDLHYLEGESNMANEFGWYKYFAVRPYSINDAGIIASYEFERMYRNENGEYHNNRKNEEDIEVFLYRRGLIPYENILTFNLHSDEGRPIFYCSFQGEKGPFRELSWTEDY